MFTIIEDDFVWLSGQADLPPTIPKYSIIQALSDALHVPPVGYLDFIRDGRIEIKQGAVDGLCENLVEFTPTNGETQLLKADHIISATGHNLVSTCILLSDLYSYLLTHTRHYHFSPQTSSRAQSDRRLCIWRFSQPLVHQASPSNSL
jgi:hypothetical protein